MQYLCAILTTFGLIWLGLAVLGTMGDERDVIRAGVMAFVGLCLVIVAAILRPRRDDRP